MDRLLRNLVRRGVRQGLLGGSTGWLVFGAAAFLLRLARRPGRASVYRHKLRVGERLEIVHLPAPATRRQRRRAEARAAGARATGADLLVDGSGPQANVAS